MSLGMILLIVVVLMLVGSSKLAAQPKLGLWSQWWCWAGAADSDRLLLMARYSANLTSLVSGDWDQLRTIASM